MCKLVINAMKCSIGGEATSVLAALTGCTGALLP